jgi:hypothetical protein
MVTGRKIKELETGCVPKLSALVPQVIDFMVGVTRYALFLRYGSVFAFGSQADTVVRQASNIGSLFFGCLQKAGFVNFQLDAIVQRCGRVRQAPARRQNPINRHACCGV